MFLLKTYDFWTYLITYSKVSLLLEYKYLSKRKFVLFLDVGIEKALQVV